MVFLAIQVFAYSATAQITIDEGPVYVPLGAGTESYSNPFTPGKAAGATVYQTGYDLSKTDNLWFGLRVDTGQNGYSMNGTDFSSGEIFRYWVSTSNSIEYRGETEFVATCPYAMYAITTRLILTFTGTGSTVLDATTIALNDPINGDVNVLWHVQSSDFTIGVAIDALVPPGISNAGNWEPANDLFNRLQYLCPEQNQTGTSIDWGFYYQGPPILIFDDGFEGGSTNAWSSTVP
jgi:hypothetical protein